jgi:methylenetetrahydrofolate dehydrogenase (NADP+)/methenyltetrahydrofolate cyclohydrolase
MTARILSGTDASTEILADIKQSVARLRQEHGAVPGLVTIQLGDNPASTSYVTLKIKTAHDLGFQEIQSSQPATLTESELLALIARYNRDDSIHGILVQLPLPKHIDESKVLYAIDPDKDVDGFHPVNAGRLLIGGEQVKFPPCTPAGIQELIRRAGVPTKGAELVVVGRSNIVGKPIAVMMLEKSAAANATVTVAHTATRDLAAHCRRADILVVAAGVPGLVQPDWIKPGACVIDVGVNRVGERISEKTGKKMAVLRGDVDYERAREIAGWITPVPGGVGPMTIAMLMRNTLRSLEYRLGLR